MKDKYKAQQLKSSEYYSSVVDVSFYPEFELPVKKVASKGDPIYRECGFLGLKKEKVGEVDEDQYDYYEPGEYISYHKSTLSELESRKYHRVVRDGKLCRNARVEVVNKKGTDVTWFDTNGDAVEFLEDVKVKCGQCGNKLL
jgi:hypothetical protein